MTDFRNLQHYIAQIRVSPSPEEFYLEGYTLVRQCHAEAQAVLNAPFNANPSPGEDVEQQKVLLKACGALSLCRIPDANSAVQRAPRCQSTPLPLPENLPARNGSHALDQLAQRHVAGAERGSCGAAERRRFPASGEHARRLDSRTGLTQRCRSLRTSRTNTSSTASGPRTSSKGNGSTRTLSSPSCSSTCSRRRATHGYHSTPIPSRPGASRRETIDMTLAAKHFPIA